MTPTLMHAMRPGSVLWMAPEMLLGESYNEKSDVYSYALCLVEMVDCHLPWTDCCPPTAITLKATRGAHTLCCKLQIRQCSCMHVPACNALCDHVGPI